VIVATGGSGHGFKFGSVIGEVIIDRLDGRATTGWAPQMSWERVTSAVAGSVPR
jgi:glycine/D-amino acid oxidase-like deaminating enzyme